MTTKAVGVGVGVTAGRQRGMWANGGGPFRKVWCEGETQGRGRSSQGKPAKMQETRSACTNGKDPAEIERGRVETAQEAGGI